MSFSKGSLSINLEDIENFVTESEILAFYLDIKKIPCVISSPLRKDDKPSFGLYSIDGKKVRFLDWATGEKGGTYDLLSQLWSLPYQKVLEKISKDMNLFNKSIEIKNYKKSNNFIIETLNKEHSSIKVKIRKWEDYDIEYWKSYGISKEWLEYAEVYPISHKFIIKNNKTYTFGTDKYAYCYIERKEGHLSIKIYQPYNKRGFKWCTSTDKSVVSLWTKIPEIGDKLCICSSLKDALCLWSNTGIPAIATQGEGYTMSDTAILNLKTRYKHIYILYDNDEPGIIDGEKLSKYTGFTNLVLPKFKEGKDISDLYYNLQDKEKFKNIILTLFN